MTSAKSGVTAPLPRRGSLAPIAWIRIMAGGPRDRRLAPGNVFIGRQWELAELREGLCAAQAGRGRLFVLSGEAGIGKTRLVGELADFAQNRKRESLVGTMLGGGGDPSLLAVDSDFPDHDVQRGSEPFGRHGAGRSFQCGSDCPGARGIPRLECRRAVLSPVGSGALSSI